MATGLLDWTKDQLVSDGGWPVDSVRNSGGIGSSKVQTGNVLSWKQVISFVIPWKKIWRNKNECGIRDRTNLS